MLAAAPTQQAAKMHTTKFSTYAVTTPSVSTRPRVIGALTITEPRPTYTRALPVRGFSQSDTMPRG